MKKTFFVIFLLLILALIFCSRSMIIGLWLEPKLEGTLTNLFGMPVSMEGLRADIITGKVTAKRLQFRNQPEFSSLPHFDTKNIEFNIDFPALKRNHVSIGTIRLTSLFYLIERRAFPDGPRTNIKTWINHIKAKKAASDAKKSPEDKKGPPWRVDIGNIIVENSAFIFDDTSNETAPRKYVFTQINGHLSNFSWRTPDPSRLYQQVYLTGMFGENFPAPFVIRGRSNFATSQISFDLTGKVKDGYLLEHHELFEGLPLEIVDGRYQLNLRVICHLRELKSYNRLTLQTIKVAPRWATIHAIWGLPLVGSIAFLQDQKTIQLKIPVKGNIADPKFRFFHAFRDAFQESLRVKTKGGIKSIQEGSVKLAAQTRDFITQTTERVSDSVRNIPNPIQGITETLTPKTPLDPEQKPVESHS